MGAPMAGHLRRRRPRPVRQHAQQGAAADSTRAGADACCKRARRWPSRPTSSSRWCPTRPTSQKVLFGENGVASGLTKGKTVVDMSSISPIETKAFAKQINALGCDYLDAPVSGGEVGAKAASLTIMVGGTEAAFERVKPLFAADGQEHHARRRQRRRADHQGRQPDHRRAEHRGGGRGAGVREQGGGRPGQGAPGADGRLRVVAGSSRCTASA